MYDIRVSIYCTIFRQLLLPARVLLRLEPTSPMSRNFRPLLSEICRSVAPSREIQKYKELVISEKQNLFEIDPISDAQSTLPKGLMLKRLLSWGMAPETTWY